MAQTFYTVAIAAALLGVSDSTVARKCNSGEIVSYRFGDRSIRIPASELKAYIAKSRTNGSPDPSDNNDDEVLV